MDTRTCTKCHEVKTIDQFPPAFQRKRRMETQTVCKQCKATAARLRRRGVDLEFVDWEAEAYREPEIVRLEDYATGEAKICLACGLESCIFEDENRVSCRKLTALA